MWITKSSDVVHVSNVMYARMNDVSVHANVKYEWLTNISIGV
jgi:hypothetical protein